MLSPAPSWGPSSDVTVYPLDRARSTSGHLLILYGRLLGPLLAGYMLFDKPFAYIHVPGTPLYVGELVLSVGALGALAATGYLRAAVRDEPVLALLAAYFLWGLFRLLPGLRAYGIFAIRDFALVYYCLFAFLTAAALMRSPEILERLVVQLGRLVPWLLTWLPIAVVLAAVGLHAPKVPTTSISVLYHKPGDAAIAVVAALGSLWLFPSSRSRKSRGAWSIVALLAIALIATQNRGGLLAAGAGTMVGLAFIKNRLRLIMQAVAVLALGLGLATVLSLKVPSAGRMPRRGRSRRRSCSPTWGASSASRSPVTSKARWRVVTSYGHASCRSRRRTNVSSAGPASAKTSPCRWVCSMPGPTICAAHTTRISTSWPGRAWWVFRCGSRCG